MTQGPLARRPGERHGIAVIGSANLDYVIRVAAPAAAGETVLARSLERQPGGKGANQAVAAARLDGTVYFVGCVGRDADGDVLVDRLRSEGVDTANVHLVGEHTGLAVVSVFDSGENSITVVPGANYALTPAHVSAALDALIGSIAVLVVQGEVRPDVLRAGLTNGASRSLRCVLNLAPYQAMAADVLALADPLVVNEVEAAALLGAVVFDPGEATGRLARMARSVVITAGADGAYWAGHGESGHVPTPTVSNVVDTTGAGDAFVGAMAVGLARGSGLRDAVRLGVRCGAHAVTGLGAQASYPHLSDLA